jgi:hypothetical protein
MEFHCHHSNTQFVFRSRKILVQFRSIIRFQKLTEAARPIWSHGTLAACAPILLFVNTARCFPRDARHKMPTLMIFTDDLENIAEPNLTYAQQNLHSPTPRSKAIHTIFKGSSEDNPTNKRFNFLSSNFFLSCFLCYNVLVR